jgi:pSer/pThr/pTyr-binding forkhead associated (FHA) protein
MATTTSESAHARPALLVHEGRAWPLVDGEYVIGRGDEARVQLAAPGLSRRHARVVVRQGHATLEDLNSKNGTFCNDEPVTSPRALRDGDVIQLGRRVRIDFRVPGADNTETEAPDSIGALRAVFRKDGELWTAAFEGQSAHLVEVKGFGDLVKLLAQPGVEVHCLELAERASEASVGDVILDERARREIRARASDLQHEIEAADAAHDLARAQRAREELDKLVDALTGAVGLRGRPRRLGSAAERARSAVTWRIRSAIRKIAAAHPRLGRHLDNAVRTGHFCVYRPEQPIVWYV